MTPGECMYCGLNPAEGYACVTQGDVTRWYCHGDDEGVSCYERQGIQQYVGPKVTEILLNNYLKENK